MRTQKNNPKEKVDEKMEPTSEKMIEYTQALEAANKHLVFSLKKCLSLLANVPPPGGRRGRMASYASWFQ
jgi:hypothetical protein